MHPHVAELGSWSAVLHSSTQPWYTYSLDLDWMLPPQMLVLSTQASTNIFIYSSTVHILTCDRRNFKCLSDSDALLRAAGKDSELTTR
jgi:hypothetical protein